MISTQWWTWRNSAGNISPDLMAFFFYWRCRLLSDFHVSLVAVLFIVILVVDVVVVVVMAAMEVVVIAVTTALKRPITFVKWVDKCVVWLQPRRPIEINLAGALALAWACCLLLTAYCLLLNQFHFQLQLIYSLLMRLVTPVEDDFNAPGPPRNVFNNEMIDWIRVTIASIRID